MIVAAIMATVLFTLLFSSNCFSNPPLGPSEEEPNCTLPNGKKLTVGSRVGWEFPCGLYFCEHDGLHFNKCRPARPDCTLVAPGKGPYPYCCQGAVVCEFLRPPAIFSIAFLRNLFFFL